jgi:hypothetical protein
MLEQLTGAGFLPYLHQTFTIYLDDQSPYPLELVSVQELGEAYQPGSRRPFSLVFSNPRQDAFLPQRIYPLEHPEMGSLELFLVPLGTDKNGMRYEAIFT